MKLPQLFHWAGALCLILCGWCVGDGIWQRVQAHGAALQKTIDLLERLRMEIGIRRTDLNQLLPVLQREGLAGTAGASVQTLAPFPQLTRREKLLFRECCAGLGRTEAQQECRRLELYIAQFRTLLEEQRARMWTTQELAHKLGLALGLAAAILLL